MVYIAKSVALRSPFVVQYDNSSLSGFFEFRELFDQSMPLDEIKQVINRFDGSEVAHFVSKLGLLLEKEGTRNLNYQLLVARELLPVEQQRKVLGHISQDKILAGSSKKPFRARPLITPMHILFSLKLIVLEHQFSVAEKLYVERDTENSRCLFKAMLATGEHMSGENKETSSELDRQSILFSYLIRNDLLLNREGAQNLIGRYYKLLFKLPKEVRDEKVKGDFIERQFYGAKGVSLVDYFAVGLGLIGRFAPASLENYRANGVENADQSTYLNWKEYFSPLVSPQLKDNNLTDLFCKTVAEMKKEFKESPVNSFEYSLLPFQCHPILTIPNGSAILTHLPFLLEKVTVGVYWIIFDSLTKTEKGQFQRYWGSLCQKYVEEIFKLDLIPRSSVAPKYLFVDPLYKKGGLEVRGSDLILYDRRNRELFLFEITYSGLRIETTSSTDVREALSEGIEKVVDKVEQLHNTIDDIKAKHLEFASVDSLRIKRFRPFVITLNRIPNWGFVWRGIAGVWRGIDERIAERNLLAGSKIAPLCLLNFDDLENLVETHRSKNDFLDLLREWSESYKWSGESLQNFLAFKRIKGAFLATSLSQCFNEAFETVQNHLFEENE